MTATEEREYLAAHKRLHRWWRADLKRRLAEIPVSKGPKSFHRAGPIHPDPLNLGGVAGKRQQQVQY